MLNIYHLKDEINKLFLQLVDYNQLIICVSNNWRDYRRSISNKVDYRLANLMSFMPKAFFKPYTKLTHFLEKVFIIYDLIFYF